MSKTKRASTGPKNAGPKRVRQWSNNELMKALTADHDRLDRKLMQVQHQFDQQGEFLIAMSVDIKDRLTALESRLPAPAEPKEEAEGWIPRLGDWVVYDEPHEGSASPGWAGVMKGLVGTLMLVTDHIRAYCVQTDSGYLWHNDWLRLATSEEISAHQLKMQEAAKKAAEEAERAKVIDFGTPAKHGTLDDLRVSVPWPDENNRYELVRKRTDGTVEFFDLKRHEFTVLTD